MDETCDECGAQMTAVSDVVRGPPGICDSQKHECTECGNVEHVPVW